MTHAARLEERRQAFGYIALSNFALLLMGAYLGLTGAAAVGLGVMLLAGLLLWAALEWLERASLEVELRRDQRRQQFGDGELGRRRRLLRRIGAAESVVFGIALLVVFWWDRTLLGYGMMGAGFAAWWVASWWIRRRGG